MIASINVNIRRAVRRSSISALSPVRAATAAAWAIEQAPEVTCPCTAPIASAGQESAAAPALVLRNGTWTMEVAAGCDPALLHLALRAIK